VVVSSPGSGASLYAQVVAKLASEIMKVPVNMVHKPSGNGNLALRLRDVQAR
jgi:tripartite-type tricarboxylate transporter receptor subunit TctC